MKNSTKSPKQQTAILAFFGGMADPRRITKGNIQHRLTDIFFLVISAVVCGCNEWSEIEIFGKSQLKWLRKFGNFENGIPSHDTLGRLFSRLNPDEFSQCFSRWTQYLCRETDGQVVAIDGKRLRGSYDRHSDKPALHVVSAFASKNGLCLGQVSCEAKSNEIKAIPQLLELIAIKGCVVTIDAMGCQTEIAKKIREKKADYILAVKENQAELSEQVKKTFAISTVQSVDVQTDSGHGRVEERKCSVIGDLTFFDVKDQWKDIKTIIKIESTRYIKVSGQVQEEVRYYISSLNADALKINNAVRNHWSIENNLHWMLDVVFKEDDSRKRDGNSAENFNLILKTALALIVKEDSQKISKKSKRLLAALNSDFREKILKC